MERFKKPGALDRPAPFWSWNDKLERGELGRQLELFSEGGIGGIFIHSRAGLVTEYLSDTWMELVGECAKRASKLGMVTWLYDEDRWPSGFGGGAVGSVPDYRQRALLLLRKDEIEDGDEILSEYEDYLICKRVSKPGNPRYNFSTYIDTMNKEAVRAFLESTHEKYKRHLGKYFGEEIVGVFTDEPSYIIHWEYRVPALQWSETFPDEFLKIKGYDIMEHLHELFFEVGDWRKTRYDFFDVSLKLFLESYTKQYAAWCSEHNLLMTGHYMCEDSLISQTQYIGAAMPHYEYMHVPGIDKLGRGLDEIVTAKQLTSAADQLDKPAALCEAFGGMGQQTGFYERKKIVDWLAALGINYLNTHLSLYSMRGERKRDYPPNLFYQQPWWEDEAEFSGYVGRLSYALRQGRREVDICVLHTITSVWCEYSPKDASPDACLYTKGFDELSSELLKNHLDFHYGDETLIKRHGKVKDGKFIIGSCAYSAVVIPPSLNISSVTAGLLEKFMAQGGKVIIIEPEPKRVNGEEVRFSLLDSAVRVKDIREAVFLLDEIYKDRISIIDNESKRRAGEIFVHRRKDAGGEYCFLANTSEKYIDAEVSLDGRSIPCALDLRTGEMFKAPARYGESRRFSLKIKFAPAGSVLLFIPNERLNLPDYSPLLRSGVCFEDLTEAERISDFDVKVLNENVLRLDRADFELGGKAVFQNAPIERIWKEFYSAGEGEEFYLKYEFVSEIAGPACAVIEAAENLDEILFNDEAAAPSGEWFVDKTFSRVPITLKTGVNTLKIRGKKSNNIVCSSDIDAYSLSLHEHMTHRPTEAEAVYITGRFLLKKRGSEYVIAEETKPDGRNLTESGYPFYAGDVKYTFRLPRTGKRRILKIGSASCVSAKVYVNGVLAGKSLWRDDFVDLTDYLDEDENEVDIIISPSLFNMLGPSRIKGALEDNFTSPRLFWDFGRMKDERELVPLGLESVSIINI